MSFTRTPFVMYLSASREEVIHQLYASHSREFDWIDESREDFEDFGGVCNWDEWESVVPRRGLRER